ncbi:hypothetical protein FKW77_005222 [Venturia effusa]|uniref:Carboxypeptidase n=1 Tax=Venturia effusa TaxID=50376 RepID=A0A517L991_9PEZI|nr:hypothetical protein FKW77_005222 [Venturia effusa]
MLQFASRMFALIACLFALLNGLSSARETMDERARSFRQRRSKLMSPGKHSPLERRGNSTWRFLNDKSQAYVVKSLPGINFDLGEMYAGQIPVGNDSSRKMFFVYQPTIGHPVDEVVVWFNGGPGCSSLEGFLQENGRFIWNWGQYSATENMYTWVNLTNVLWVEYPVGVGFSTGKVTAASEEDIADDFIAFFKNFLDIFAIKNFKIYVTGESYAGRYVSFVSAAMLDQNDTKSFDLRGALMYDPAIGQHEYVEQTIPTVPYVQEYSKFFNFNKTFMDQLASAHKSCGYADYLDKYMVFPPAGVQPWLKGSFSNPSDRCDVWDLAWSAAFRPNPCFNVYAINNMCPIQSDPIGFPSDIQYQYAGMGGTYFDRSDVKTALNVPQDLSWSECSAPVFAKSAPRGPYRNGDNSLDPIQHVLPKVIEATNRVLIANGEYDFVIMTNGVLLSIQNMTWGGALGFQSKPTTPIDIQLPDLQWQSALVNSGLDGLDGPGQGIMGVQHYERGLMWAETYQCDAPEVMTKLEAKILLRHSSLLSPNSQFSNSEDFKMPMPTDEALVAKADEVKNLFKGAFGTPPGYRPGKTNPSPPLPPPSLRTITNPHPPPAHAKGTVLTGTWQPTSPPSPLSKAWHISNPTTVLARFSSSTGIPSIPDNDPNASPKGLAIRFNYPPTTDGKRKHTDIIAHSTPHFPTRTGAEFGEFLRAFGASQAPGVEHPTPIESFLGSHTYTREFVEAEKPLPVSFGTEGYWGLNAFKFIAEDGEETFVRYEFVPVAGFSHLSPSDAAAKSPNYLDEEVRERINQGPVGMKLLVQIAAEGDVVDDVTVHWPAEREKVELGTVWLDTVDEDGAGTQKKTIFDPIPRVEGIEASKDPLLDFRAAVYLISGRERREA